MFRCLLYIHNTKKACFVRLRVCPYAPYIWMPPVCWDAPICLDAPVCLDTPIGLDAPICLDDVWTPLYLHNTKKACFVRLRGCPYAPIHLDAPYSWMHPCVFECPHMFGWSPVCLDASICLDVHLYVWCPHMFGCPPVCLDTPCMFALPHLFGCPLYVWCSLHLNTPLYGWMSPHVWTPPCIFVCSPYVWLPPVCLDAPKCMGASKGMRDIQTYG